LSSLCLLERSVERGAVATCEALANRKQVGSLRWREQREIAASRSTAPDGESKGRLLLKGESVACMRRVNKRERERSVDCYLLEAKGWVNIRLNPRILNGPD
jgi:hypothetical protein